MGKTVLVTGGTSKDVHAIGVLALNIKKVIPDFADELIVFHDGICKKDQKIINQIFPTKFCEFRFPVSFLDKRKNANIRYFSPMVFCKYECFRLLEQYERVVWTDYDIVILKDISELLKSDAGLQIVEEREPLKTRFKDDGKCVQKEYNLEKHGVSTPLFVLTRNIGDYKKYYTWCIENTKKYMAYINLPEQCIISMLIQKFEIEYETILDEKYALHPRLYDGKASIVHAYGRPKFWEGLENEEWDKYYQQWISLGGSRYTKPLKEKILQIFKKR